MSREPAGPVQGCACAQEISAWCFTSPIPLPRSLGGQGGRTPRLTLPLTSEVREEKEEEEVEEEEEGEEEEVGGGEGGRGSSGCRLM